MLDPLAPTEAAIRVLVVDDTPDIRFLLRMALGTEDDMVVVGEAGDGLAAVDEAARTRPDVVLLDLAMPVMDGLEALPLVKQACPDAHVVILSGFEATAMAGSAQAAGAAAYLQKGVAPDVIISCIRRLARPAAVDVPTVRPASLPPGATVWSWVDALAAGVVVLDPEDGHVLHANAEAARLLGWSGAVPDDAAQRLERARSSGRLVVEESAAKDARVAHLRPAAPMAASEEVARIREAIASTAHELRNPVGALLGVAQTLARRGDRLTPEKQTMLLGAIERQAQVLDRLTGDLLAASHAELGLLDCHSRDVPLRPALESAALLIGGAHVLVDCPDDLVVHADPVRLDQMVVNLLTNAQKYGAAPISLSAFRQGASASLEVSDRGPGVPEDFRPRLFQQYARAAGTRRAGSGVGLFLVRALAEAQGGRAWYRPHAKGGSVFGFSLPTAG